MPLTNTSETPHRTAEITDQVPVGRVESRGAPSFACAGVVTTAATAHTSPTRRSPRPRGRRAVTREVWMRLVYYGLVTPEIATRVFFPTDALFPPEEDGVEEEAEA